MKPWDSSPGCIAPGRSQTLITGDLGTTFEFVTWSYQTVKRIRNLVSWYTTIVQSRSLCDLTCDLTIRRQTSRWDLTEKLEDDGMVTWAGLTH